MFQHSLYNLSLQHSACVLYTAFVSLCFLCTAIDIFGLPSKLKTTLLLYPLYPCVPVSWYKKDENLKAVAASARSWMRSCAVTASRRSVWMLC